MEPPGTATTPGVTAVAVLTSDASDRLTEAIGSAPLCGTAGCSLRTRNLAVLGAWVAYEGHTKLIVLEFPYFLKLRN